MQSARLPKLDIKEIKPQEKKEPADFESQKQKQQAEAYKAEAIPVVRQMSPEEFDEMKEKAHQIKEAIDAATEQERAIRALKVNVISLLVTYGAISLGRDLYRASKVLYGFLKGKPDEVLDAVVNE